MNLYPLGKALTYLLVRVLFRMRYEGLENIPNSQGFILACNHRSNFDPLFIAHKVPVQLHYMAKAELFQNKILGWILHGVGSFPVARGTGDMSAMDAAARLIREGGILGMFPEGHRSKDGTPLRARNGIGMVAAQTGSGVLPCAVIYGDRLRFRTTVTVRYGKLITKEALGLTGDSPSSIRKASKRVMEEVVALLGPAPSGEALPPAKGEA